MTTSAALCAGYGGLDMAVEAVTGAQVDWYAETCPDASAVMAHHHPRARNIGDITTADWTEVMPTGSRPVDVLTAGYP